jgi:succinate-acetate transporter protein
VLCIATVVEVVGVATVVGAVGIVVSSVVWLVASGSVAPLSSVHDGR